MVWSMPSSWYSSVVESGQDVFIKAVNLAMNGHYIDLVNHINKIECGTPIRVTNASIVAVLLTK